MLIGTTAFAAYNPGLNRLEIYVKDSEGESLLGAFGFGQKKQEVEDFILNLKADHDLDIENLGAILEDDRYDTKFV